MAKRNPREPELIIRRSEDTEVPRGETVNWVLLDDATVEALARGICPEALAERMWRLLGLEREQLRVQAAAMNDDPDVVLKRAAGR